MKKLVYVLVLMLFINVNTIFGEENTLNDNINVADIKDTIKDNNARYILTITGKVYVSGSNAYGQLGLGLPIDSNITIDETNLGQELLNLPAIEAISYDDYTLTLTTANPNVKYVFGKKAYAPSLSYNNKQNTYLKNAVSSFPQKVTFTNDIITNLECYQNKKLNSYKSITLLSATQNKTSLYNTANKIIENRYYHYSNNMIAKSFIDYYSLGKINKELDYFFSKGILTTLNDYRYYNKKKKLYTQTKYINKIKRHYEVRLYDKKANYITKKTNYTYDSKARLAKKLVQNYNSKKKRTYKWYATYRPDLKIRLGVTKTKYNSKGKLISIDATVEGIKYYSQKNKAWRNKICKIAPYNGIIQENGCMLSSFAMINSKYAKNINPGQMLDYGLDCNLNYNKAAKALGYKVQNTYPTSRYTRNVNTPIYNSSKLIKNGKKTYTIKESINNYHTPVQIWLTPKKALHRGHSVVAYRYIYKNGKWDIKIYDPYTPKAPKRFLKDMSTRHYIAKAQIWEKDAK